MEFDQSIFGSQRLELVFSRNKFISGLRGNLFGNRLSESKVSIETSTDCSASLGNLLDVLDRLLDSFNTFLDLVGVP